jgi:hypothetical protein
VVVWLKERKKELPLEELSVCNPGNFVLYKYGNGNERALTIFGGI